MNSNFQSNGFEFINHFLSKEELLPIKNEINLLPLVELKGGLRNAQNSIVSINKLVRSEKLINKAKEYLLGIPNFVRVILFDKNPESNWQVPWHQDQTIAVSDKFDEIGWGPWSIKDGVHHVRPPLKCLQDMVVCRIHIDDTSNKNGCLRVIPGSHLLGLLSYQDIQSISKTEVFEAEGREGSVIFMRPHLLHSSRKSQNYNSRRIIHVEYSSYQLPKGINWI